MMHTGAGLELDYRDRVIKSIIAMEIWEERRCRMCTQRTPLCKLKTWYEKKQDHESPQNHGHPVRMESQVET